MKAYRQHSYVKKREFAHRQKPEVKARMAETNRKFAKTEKRKQYLKVYHQRESFKEYRRAWENQHHKEDPNYHIACMIRKNLRLAIRRHSMGKKYLGKMYGIDFSGIVEQLGLPPNDGKEYHIDHKIPCCAFDLTKPEELKKCVSPENLRWLTAEENRRKLSDDLKMSIHNSVRRDYT